MYLGDLNPSDILDFKFTTVDGGGAPAALSSGDFVVYKDNSVTQSTGGITLTSTFDSLVGLNNGRIDTSADATFYSAGSNFHIVLSTGTVSGVSVIGYVVGQFSIQYRSHLMPTVAGRTLDVNAQGQAGVDWANVGGQATAVALSATSVKTATDVETDTQDIQSRLPTALTSGLMMASAEAIAGTAVDTIVDEEVDGTVTLRQTLRLANSANGGKLSGAGTLNVVIRDLADTKDRVTATVDVDGNRTTVVRDLT